MILDKKIDELIDRLVDYLGVDKLPIEFSCTIYDDSRLVLKPNPKIVINEKFTDSFFDLSKAIAHEYRHWFQLNWVSYMDDDLSNRWRKAFNNALSLENADIINSIDDSTAYVMQDIEIDAFAFTKYYLEKYEGMIVVHPNTQYEDLIKKYIEINNRIM